MTVLLLYAVRTINYLFHYQISSWYSPTQFTHAISRADMIHFSRLVVAPPSPTAGDKRRSKSRCHCCPPSFAIARKGSSETLSHKGNRAQLNTACIQGRLSGRDGCTAVWMYCGVVKHCKHHEGANNHDLLEQDVDLAGGKCHACLN